MFVVHSHFIAGTVLTQLSIIAKRMARRNVYMKELDLIETFGATTIIASDKTGTLTKNVMAVTDLWYNRTFVQGRPDQRTTAGALDESKLGRAAVQRPWMAGGDLNAFNDATLVSCYGHVFTDLIMAMAVCNKATCSSSAAAPADCPVSDPAVDVEQEVAQVDQDAEVVRETLTITGSPSESALLRYVDELSDIQAIRTRFDIVFEVIWLHRGIQSRLADSLQLHSQVPLGRRRGSQAQRQRWATEEAGELSGADER